MIIVKNIIRSNRTLFKFIYSIGIINFILTAFVGCVSDPNNQNIFFKKYYTAPNEIGCLNVFINKDTVFINRNTYSAIDNDLEYLVLNAKEKKSLKSILTELKGKNIKSSYGGGNHDYVFYWEVLSENIETEVLDSVNPNSLEPLYDFILNKSETSRMSTKKINNLIYSSININLISELEGRNIAYSSNVQKDRVLYLIWHQLMKSKQRDFYNIFDVDDFDYEVKYSYLINTFEKPIERIYLKKLSTLAIKFKDSTAYKAIKLKHTLF